MKERLMTSGRKGGGKGSVREQLIWTKTNALCNPKPLACCTALTEYSFFKVFDGNYCWRCSLRQLLRWKNVFFFIQGMGNGCRNNVIREGQIFRSLSHLPTSSLPSSRKCKECILRVESKTGACEQPTLIELQRNKIIISVQKTGLTQTGGLEIAKTAQHKNENKEQKTRSTKNKRNSVCRMIVPPFSINVNSENNQSLLFLSPLFLFLVVCSTPPCESRALIIKRGSARKLHLGTPVLGCHGQRGTCHFPSSIKGRRQRPSKPRALHRPAIPPREENEIYQTYIHAGKQAHVYVRTLRQTLLP